MLSTITQSLLALTFNLGSVFAGGIVSFLSYGFIEFPWILALFPPVLTIRGDIGGILSGKLGTMLNTGRVRPSFVGNTKEFYLLLKSIFVLAFLDTLGMGLFSFFLNLGIGSAKVDHLLIYLFLPTFVCLASVTVALPITVVVAILSFRKGFNPDIVVYPAVSMMNDIIVASVFFFAVKTIERGLLSLLALFSLLSAFLVLWFCKSHIGESSFRKTIFEGVSSVFASSLLGSFSGSILTGFRLKIEGFPGLIAIYPAMMSVLGGIGSIIGSMTTTKLAIGLGRSIKQRLQIFVKDAIAVEISAFTIFCFLGLLGAFFSGGPIGSSAFALIRVSLFTNLIGFLVISIFSFVIAEGTFKKGWDPDNFVVPMVTSSADLTTTLLLFLGVYLFQ
ncbi:MAG: hypothetical protein DRO00_08170 [Thermoproteota archaeon]|nr:MAG: hypothetical protein DRO00_08170 [Candidatus Korarchaeota archaeon]